MIPPKGDGSSLFTRVVREPLDSVVAPLVRDALIHDALGVMHLSAPPIDLAALETFVNGGLKSVLERALGAELGRSVVEEMLHALSTVPSLSRPPRPGPRIPRPRSMAPARPASSVPPVGSARPASSVPPAGTARPASSVPPASTSAAPAPQGARATSTRPLGSALTTPHPLSEAITSQAPSATDTLQPPSATATPRIGHASWLPRPRPTPVPYGMRRPTPPPGMVDARSRPPALPSTDGDIDLPEVTRRDSLPPVSGERARAGRSRPPLPSVTVQRAPLVLVGTEDKAFFETLARSFEDHARVRKVLSAADVVRELDEAGASRKLVILDAKMPSVRPAALAVLLESIRGVEVVLCRSLPETEERILSVSPASANWIIYREPAPLDRVAEACIGLVARAPAAGTGAT